MVNLSRGVTHLLPFVVMAAAVAPLFSNAVSQILLGVAILLLLLQWQKAAMPPVALPLILFLGGTLLAVALSEEPRVGLPQVKKFYVFAMLPVLYTAIRSAEQVRTIYFGWVLLATGSAGWAFVQFSRKWSDTVAARQDFYLAYVGSRVTGFMSHWMTFSAEQMIVGLMLTSLLIFGAFRTRRFLWLGALCIIGASIGVAWTRSVWLGTIAGVCYLIAAWRPGLLLLVPPLLAVIWFIAPASLQERVTSLYKPHGTSDSNEHRRITARTGVEMVRAHPWFGLGPEMPGRQFARYLPSDVTRPLPSGFYGHLHNLYLQYAAERGIPVLLVFLWLIVRVIRDFVIGARKIVVDDAFRRAALHGSVAAIIGLLVEGLFEHNLGDSEILTLFLVIVASGYVLLRKDEAAHA
ncbi:MAG: O-antigen ligase family protein [Bryobacteraceae bacterium]|nr:O-antigen ligase family protein [Bryobacteraceae bacterium]